MGNANRHQQLKQSGEQHTNTIMGNLKRQQQQRPTGKQHNKRKKLKHAHSKTTTSKTTWETI